MYYNYRNYKAPKPRTNLLDHLDEDRFKEFIFDFYNSTKPLKELQIEYELPTIMKLHEAMPFLNTDIKCIHCESNLIIEPHSRTGEKNNAECVDCGHYNIKNCNCTNCIALEEKRKEEQKESEIKLFIKYINLQKERSHLFDDLSFEEKIALSFLIRYCSSDDFEYIKPLNQKSQLA